MHDVTIGIGLLILVGVVWCIVQEVKERLA